MKKLDSFTLRNFEKTGGGSIRISGILNALSEKGVQVRVFSFFKQVDYFHSSIEFVQLPDVLNSIDKRKFQFALSFFPISVVNKLFHTELTALRNFFKDIDSIHEPVLFFEYLDNSIAYLLKENGVINSYMNDIHGITPLEFRENTDTSLKSKLLFKIKELAAVALDNKTVNNAQAILYPSEGVKNYFEKNVYKNKIDSIVVDEAINELLLEQEIDSSVKKELIKEGLFSETDRVVMFIGDFKPFGGVEDLFNAAKMLHQQHKTEHLKFIFIGDGQLYERLKHRAKEEQLTNIVRFLGRVPYTKLLSYQNCADILVCPDRNTVYSQLLPHIKYYDSISSGKVVVHGKFDFSEQLNPNEQFSIDFEPSNVTSLAEKIWFALENLEELVAKYSENSKEARSRYTYQNSIEELYNYIQ